MWELAFGNWVLLQPERIKACAQAVIRTSQADEHQRGCLMEKRVVKGDLAYEFSMPALAGDEEFCIQQLSIGPKDRPLTGPLTCRRKIGQYQHDGRTSPQRN